jgi:glycosyltransferase involved in cell wall biosynthesis
MGSDLTPRVSVVLPVRDGEMYLSSAIRSVLAQSYADFELLVVDDGSSDATPAIAETFAHADPRVQVIRTPPVGLVGALNLGVSVARGEYIARMDADDIALPDRFDRQVRELDSRDRLGALGVQVRYIDEAGNPVGVWDLPVGAPLVRWRLFFGTALAHPAAMIRTALLRENPYDVRATHAEDYDLWVRLSTVADLDNLQETLMERRVHGRSVSDLNAAVQEASVRGIQRRFLESSLGAAVTDKQIKALRDPRTIGDVLHGLRLITRLYRASDRTPAIRADAAQRVRALVRAMLARHV